MKFYISSFIFILMFQTINLYAQQQTKDAVKYIEVTGSAEQTVKPDEIELDISITEYSKDGLVVKLDNIESEFYTILTNNKIDIEGLKLNGIESNYWWYRWNNRGKALKTKSYKISINSDVNFLKLTDDLNKKWIESIDISDKKNKKIQEYRKEVKIAAIKAAKEKATYLLEAIGEKLGGVLSVQENSEGSSSFFRRNDMLSNTAMGSNSSNNDVGNVEGIKIRYEMVVKFEIK